MWEGVFKAYTRSFIRRNMWRLSRTCDEDDAMQEARIVFLRCARQYKGVIDNDAWFMGIYKRSLAGRFADLATADARHRMVSVLMCDIENEEGEQVPLDMVGETANEGELRVLIAQAPSEVREVLALLLEAPAEVLELAASAWRRKGKKSAFGNAMLCRLLGRDEGTDVLGKVREYLMS